MTTTTASGNGRRKLALAFLAVLLSLSPTPAQEQQELKEQLRAARTRLEALRAKGKDAEAVAECRGALELAEKLHGRDSLEAAALLNDLGGLHSVHGRPLQAITAL